MSVDAMTIRVKERSFLAIYDLALIVLLRHLGAATLLVLAPGAPIAFVMYRLIERPYAPAQGSLMWFAFATFVLTPVWTAPLTHYLGQALFSDSPSVARAFKDAAWRLPRQVFGALLPRALMCLFPILILFLNSPFHSEVLALERQGLRATSRRARTLASGFGAHRGGHVMTSLAIVVFGVVFGSWALNSLIGTFDARFSLAEDVLPLLNPGRSLLPWFVILPITGYLAVARFLAYIDVRTRMEGWQIEIGLRRSAERLRRLEDE